LLVVFGELFPKTLALQTPEKTALLVARPLIVFERLTRPLIVVINGAGNLLLRLCGFRPPTGQEMVHSVEELQMLIEDTEEAGILDAEQAEYAQNVFRLSDKRVRDCMVPREKMLTLELNSPPDKILEAVRQGASTRMPVYEGDLDNIVGIVNTKDLFYLFSLRGVVVLEDALYPPLFVKPDDPMVQVLSLFRRSHRPMALVRGPDNKILGLITLEDVLEEIVGDIEDEHDRPIPKVRLKRRPSPGPKAGGAK
jgi:CBS domain containing-hemolysin-like protein